MIKIVTGALIIILAGVLLVSTLMISQTTPEPREVLKASTQQTPDIEPDSTISNQLNAILDGVNSLEESVKMLGQRVDKLENANQPKFKQDEGLQESLDVDLDAKHQGFVNALNSKFAAEPITGNLSETKNGIENLFLDIEKPYNQHVQVKDIECRSSSCRLVVSMDEGFDVQDFETNFLGDVARVGLSRVRGYASKDSGDRSYVYFLSNPPPPRDKIHSH